MSHRLESAAEIMGNILFSIDANYIKQILLLRDSCNIHDPAGGKNCKIIALNTDSDMNSYVSQLLGTRLGLLASICQSTTRIQVMTRL